MANDRQVFVVDDDQAVRDSLSWLLESVGIAVEAYASGPDFLNAYYPGRPGCLLLDVRMPGMSGLDLQEHLAEIGGYIPIIIITGHADVPMAVRAMKAGAFDFVEKPFNDQMLLERIDKALDKDRHERESQRDTAGILRSLQSLTPREREVMEMVVQGMSNKMIAARRGVSQKTIDHQRARVMEKMQAGSLAELVRMVLRVESAGS